MLSVKGAIVFAAVMAGAFLASAAERTPYAENSKIQTKAIQQESSRYVNNGWWIVGMSLVPALQVPDERHIIFPLRANLLVGRHLDVYGVDTGLIGNEVVREFCGVQACGLYNKIGESRGAVQAAALINRCDGNFAGVQVGLINQIEKGTGLQLGLVNYSNVYTGLQLGLVNIINSSSVSFMPIANFAF